MSTATLTSKGQVTIPKSVRETLGVKTGDKLEFLTRHDGVVEIRPRSIDLLDLFGIIKPARRGVTLSEMEEAIESEGGRRLPTD